MIDARYCLPTTCLRYAHSWSLLLCYCLPHYSKSVYSVTQAQVDVRSYGTQPEPSTMTQASGQHHTTSFCSPTVLGDTHNTHNVRMTVRMIAWASEKDITNVKRMQITRSLRWLELLKNQTYEISARDLQKPFREFKHRNSFLWTNTGVTNMLTLPRDKVFVNLQNPVKK